MQDYTGPRPGHHLPPAGPHPRPAPRLRPVLLPAPAPVCRPGLPGHHRPGTHTDRLHGTERTEQIEATTATRYLRFRRGPDCLLLTGRLPLDEGLALQQHLEHEASAAHHRGDRRSKQQLLCDLFIRRAVHAGGGRLPLRLVLKLIITDRALFQCDAEPAYLPGYGIIPTQYARRMIAGARLRREHLHSQPAKDEAGWRIESFPEIQRLFTAATRS